MPRSELRRLSQLAEAYAVPGQLDEVVDAIMSRVSGAVGETARAAVLEVVSRVLRDEGALEALKAGHQIPELLRIEMSVAVRRHHPRIPSAGLVDLVLADVAAALGTIGRSHK